MPSPPTDLPFELSAPYAGSLRLYKVHVGKRQSRKVVAHYFKVEDGALAFRISNPRGGYPHMVAMFAPGSWLEVR